MHNNDCDLTAFQVNGASDITVGSNGGSGNSGSGRETGSNGDSGTASGSNGESRLTNGIDFKTHFPEESQDKDQWRCNLTYYFLGTYSNTLRVTKEVIYTFAKLCVHEH